MARGKKKETILTPEEKLHQVLLPENEWPYKVPGNWCWTRIECINRYDSGSIDPSKEPALMYELYSVPSSANNYPEVLAGQDIGSTKQEVEKGDVLLCKINPRINRVWKVSQHTENKLLASSEWIIIRNENILADYLMYCFRSPYFRDYMLSNVSGVGGSLMRAQPKFVKSYPLPIPPLPEQRRIVDRIESLFAKLDEAKEKAQAVVVGFEDRKAAILHKAFTGELTAEWRETKKINKETTWKTETLQSVCSMKITDGTHKTPTYCNAEEGIPFISAKDVTSGVICWDNIKYIIPELHEELYKRLSPKIDDVLLAKNGTTGVAAIVEEEKVFDLYVTLAVLRPNKNMINPRYLLNVVNSPICKRQFDEHLTGIGVPNLHLRDIKEIKIPLPSLNEQIRIVHIIDSMLEKCNEALSTAEIVLIKIDTMKKSILARAFRGELGTNDPADESAEELLKRIL